MKKLALNLLKSADEKLRGISKQPGAKPLSPTAPEPQQVEGDNMAERRIQQRQGRRDRFRGNEGGRGDQQAKAEAKRRSRSEGPTNRISLQNEDKQEDFAYGKKNEKIMGPIWAVTHSSTATRVSRHSPPASDDGSLIHVQEIRARTEGSDSDSNDSDTKVWTKNPLVVRKTRKSGKIEKRQSGNENGFSTGIPVKTNRDSFVYYDKTEGGGSARGNKYQKLEELRKKRIDIQMTSDEENTPESRISRLRQRAIQSGLGKQPKAESFRQSAVIPGSPTQNYSPKSPKSPGAFFPNGSGDHGLGVTSKSGGGPRSSVIQSSSFQSVNGVPASAYGSSYGANQSSSGQTRQSHIRPFDAKGFSDSGIPGRQNPPANANRFSQHQEVKIPPNKTAVYSSSPEVMVKQPFDRPRVPSVDSIYEGTNPNHQEPLSPSMDYGRKFGSGSTYQNVGHGFVYMRPTSSSTMELPTGNMVKVPPKQMQRQSGNDIVELRLKTRQVIDRPSGPNLIDQQRKLRANIVANSDDSLDELIESNIQYLESEIESGRVKKTSAPVSRSASLPDPRRSSGHFIPAKSGPLHSGVLPTSFVSAQQQRSMNTIPSQPHVKAGSELKFHLSIPGNPVQSPPEIRIADENRINGNVRYGINPPASNLNSGLLISEPNFSNFGAPERKFSYDSRSASHLTAGDMSRDSFSKSDSQLNTAPPMTYLREHPRNQAFMNPKYNSSDELVSSGLGLLNIPQLDRGMFSDVDYDIEVAERVNRWETYMKKRSDPELGIIKERNEEDLLPRNIRRSVYVEQKLEIPESPVGPVSQSISWSNLQTLKPSSSDPTIHLSVDPQLIAQETNRMFQLIREPTSGARFHTATSAVSTFYHAPSPQRATGGLMSAAELREQMMANKQPIESGPGIPAITEQGNRASRYQELEEIRGVKSDSVRDLCKRFDLELGDEADDDSEIPSPSKQDTDTDWSKLISDLEDKIKETEVWSPNMESNQGDMVSIERVKARTLQTIPFSEDPFWKEIEEMTSFEKMFNGTGLDDPITYRQHQLDYPHSQSYTLPTQPRTSARDRMHRSKSLYTPNITPLTISVDKYSAPSALDDVLDDIKTSLEKQSSPKIRKGGDSSDSHRSSPGPSFIDVNITSTARPRLFADSTSRWDEPRVVPPAAKPAPAPGQQGLLMYATQAQVQQAPGMQEYPNVVNGNYQLDPNLLKQKLLNTGLAEEPKVMQSSGRIRPKVPLPLIIPQPSRPSAPIFPLTQPAPLKSQPIPPPPDSVSEDKINQVNQSMEDLRTIAKDVETKISQIKTKLVTADEKNLDKILVALRKFAPAASPQTYEPRQDSFQDFYVKKKSKLSDALIELERIYKDLNLGDASMMDRAERRDYPLYRTRGSDDAANTTERPEQKIETNNISLQLNKPGRWKSQQPEQKPVADFDAISKSFQAILDEVNQTSAAMSESSKPYNFQRTSVPSQHLPQFTSPEPVRKVLAPVVSQVSSSVLRARQSPEVPRKPIMPKTGIPRPVNPSVSSPELVKRGVSLVSTNAKVVNPSTVKTVTQEPLRSLSGKAAIPTPKKPSGFDEPQRQNLQANVSKLMSQQKGSNETKSQSVSIVLKSPTASTTSSSQTSTNVSTSQTPPEVAPRERKSRGRFRSKNLNQMDEEKKARSKSTPRIDTQTSESSTSTGFGYIKLNEPAHLRQVEPVKGVSSAETPSNNTPASPKTPTATSKMEFQIKQPKTPPVVPKFEKTVGIPSQKAEAASQEAPKQRTVETQTTEEPKKLVSHGSGDKRRGTKYGRGVARMVDIFSSSDEERSRKSRPLYTRSAPDLTLGFDGDEDQDEEDMKEEDAGSKTLGHLKTHPGNLKEVEKNVNKDQATETSAPTSPSTKPPLHPLKKQTTSPEKLSAQPEERNTVSAIPRSRTRGRSAEREVESDSAVIDRPERPKSFHELLASFEPNSNRLQKLKSLRKCASEDYVVSETVVQKTFLSEPYHSEPNLREERRHVPSREGAEVSPASRNVSCTAQSSMIYRTELLLKVGM